MHSSKSSTILTRGEQPKKHGKPAKECFGIQALGAGHLPGLPNGESDPDRFQP